MTRLTRSLQRLLDETVRDLSRALGDDLVRVVLFGSRARGAASRDSDVDLLVILRSRRPELEDAVSGVTYEVMWRHRFNYLVTPLVLDEPTYEQMRLAGYSLTRNVEREGIVLWNRAA